MKQGRKIGVSLIILLGISALFFSLFTFTIRQDEVAVKKNLGKITMVYVDEQEHVEKVKADLVERGYKNIAVTADKGLHFKWPFVDTVNKYSAKYITYMSTNEIINTKDKRKIDIQMFAQYKIYNPVFVNMTFGTNRNAIVSLMDDRIGPVVVQIGNSLKFTEFFEPSTTRPLLMEKNAELNEELRSQYGIIVADIGIHRKNFPVSNIASIEKKMSEEILKESEALIAQGESEYKKSVSETDRKKAEIVATAREEAAIIKAEADREALQIYNESLGKDLNFYQFIKRMETYRNIKDTTIFLDESNDFLKNINGY